MDKHNLAKSVLLAVMAASVVGASSVYAAEDFPSDNTPVKVDVEYAVQSKITGKDITITGDKTNNLTIVNGSGLTDPTGAIINADGGTKLSISDLKSLNIETPDHKVADGLNSWGGADIDINNVDVVNIGTKDNRFIGANGSPDGSQAIHAASGYVKLDNIGDLNIYTDGQGIMAQRNSDNNPNNVNNPSVYVNARGNVTIDTKGNALMAASINQLHGVAAMEIKADGQIKVISQSGALQQYDANKAPDAWEGDGDTNIILKGNKGVYIEGGNESYAAIYTVRKNTGTSMFDISASDGDVTIVGNSEKGAIKITDHPKDVTGDVDKMNLNGNISGKNVTIKAKENTNAISLSHGVLDLQADTNINISGNMSLQNQSNLNFDNRGGNESVNINLLNSTINIDNSTLNVSKGTTTHIDASKLSAGTLINVSGGGKFIADNGAKLYVANAEKGGKYQLINNVTGSTLWKDTTLELDNKFLKADIDNENLVILNETKTAKEALGVSTVIDNVVAKAGNDGKGAMFDFVNDVAGSNASAETKASAINSAANIGELGGTSHGTYSMSNIMTDAVADHLSLATHGEQDKDVWAHYIHNKENVSGLALGGVDGNYDAQYNGIVVGSDLYKNGKATVGVALSYAEGNIDGSTLAARTSNDAEYYGASVYGRIDNGDSAVIGDISYLHSKNDIEQTNSGKTITATPKADAFSVGVKAEQVFNAGTAKFVPYAGLRYMHLGVGNYTDSLGMGYNSDEQNLWLLPVGVTYSQNIKAGSWTLRPVVEAGYVWTMGDRDTQQTVSLNGASDGFGFDVADSGSFISRFALEAENANVTYGLGYEYQKGDTVKANKWMANVNFSF